MTNAPFGSGSWPTVIAIELVRVSIPLLRPHTYAGGEERDRNVVLVRAVDADGVEGWGECSALSHAGYSFETTDGAWVALRDELAPAWLAGARPAAALPMAFAALEEGALDIDLQQRGTSLADALATELGARRAGIEWCAVLGFATTQDDVEAAIRAGATQLKLKIAPDRDVDVVRSVRDAHPDLPLAVDANGSYDTAAAVPLELAHMDLTYLEQPVPPDDLRGSAAVAERLDVPIALDESITSLAKLVEALEVGACSAVSVKPARLGGLGETVRVLDKAREVGVDAFVGGMLESGVGRAVALSVAAQAPCSLPTDAGPTSRYFTEDIAPAFEPDSRGRLSPPTGVGIGAVPDPDALDRFAVERVLLRP